jgi:hypothetical protein
MKKNKEKEERPRGFYPAQLPNRPTTHPGQNPKGSPLPLSHLADTSGLPVRSPPAADCPGPPVIPVLPPELLPCMASPSAVDQSPLSEPYPLMHIYLAIKPPRSHLSLPFRFLLNPSPRLSRTQDYCRRSKLRREIAAPCPPRSRRPCHPGRLAALHIQEESCLVGFLTDAAPSRAQNALQGHRRSSRLPLPRQNEIEIGDHVSETTASCRASSRPRRHPEATGTSPSFKPEPLRRRISRRNPNSKW